MKNWPRNRQRQRLMHCQYMYSAWLPAAMPDRKSNKLSDVHGRQGVNGGAGGLIDKFSGKREMIVGTKFNQQTLWHWSELLFR